MDNSTGRQVVAALPLPEAEVREWIGERAVFTEPVAVIRRITRSGGNVPIIRYRMVTCAPTSEGRDLIGYDETGDDAAKAGWEHFHGRHAWCQREQLFSTRWLTSFDCASDLPR